MYIYTYIYINSNKPLWCVDLTNLMPMQTYCTVTVTCQCPDKKMTELTVIIDILQ